MQTINFVVGDWLTLNADSKGLEGMLELKCIALAHTMRGENEEKEKKKKYLEIESAMNGLMRRSNRHYSFFHAKTLFYAAIIMYHDVDPLEMVKMFEGLVNDGFLSYPRKEPNHEDVVDVIDLHLFELLQVQFILRYTVGFMTKNQMAIKLVVGSGKHNLRPIDCTGPNIKQFVLSELAAFDPPIRCEQDPQNEGVLCVNKEDLNPYRGNPTNSARQKLLTPSKHWYWSDSRHFDEQ